jgi:uncharacterized protein
VLRIPSATAFDYEFATVQHNVNCRLARVVMVPEAIPPERLYRFDARGKLRRYPGLKEEYYLADFEPDAAVLSELRVDRERPLVVVRTPRRSPSTTASRTPYSGGCSSGLPARTFRPWCSRAGARRPTSVRRMGAFTVPARAVSAGGTMNREAVALGTPVYTTFEGRLGAVDEVLLHEGRLHKLGDPAEIVVKRRQAHGELRIRRDPRELVKLLLSGTES